MYRIPYDDGRWRTPGGVNPLLFLDVKPDDVERFGYAVDFAFGLVPEGTTFEAWQALQKEKTAEKV